MHIPFSLLANLVRVMALVMAIIIFLPSFVVILFTLSGYVSDIAVWLSPFDVAISQKIMFAVRIIIIAVLTSLTYFYSSIWLSGKIFTPSFKKQAWLHKVEPWLFLGPALLMISIFLILPALETLRLSFINDVARLDSLGQIMYNEAGQILTEKRFIGFDNYVFLFHTKSFWLAIRNSSMWLVIVPSLCIIIGMLIAVLTDRLIWGRLAKSLFFIPLTISFVGAAVIWRNIYAAGGVGGYELGLINALVKPFGVAPRFWYETEFWGNFFLMGILIWMQTGFAMVIFSAALRSIPEEIIEAAQIDGASQSQIFFKIILPQIYGTILVVWTTLVVLVLKVFDIPYALTANKADKLLLATLMEQTHNSQREEELAAAIAIILMLIITPVMIINLWRNRAERKNEVYGG